MGEPKEGPVDGRDDGHHPSSRQGCNLISSVVRGSPYRDQYHQECSLDVTNDCCCSCQFHHDGLHNEQPIGATTSTQVGFAAVTRPNTSNYVILGS